MSRATGTIPERVQLCVPEPFHCNHIARWSARSGMTGCSGTGVNTGVRLRSGTVPVPNLWCRHSQYCRNQAKVQLYSSRIWLRTYFSCSDLQILGRTIFSTVTSLSCGLCSQTLRRNDSFEGVLHYHHLVFHRKRSCVSFSSSHNIL